MYPNEGPENSSKKSQESEREAAVADLLLALVAQCSKWVVVVSLTKAGDRLARN